MFYKLFDKKLNYCKSYVYYLNQSIGAIIVFTRRQFLVLSIYSYASKSFSQDNASFVVDNADNKNYVTNTHTLRRDTNLSNVKDFGAIGDGVTDDTKALQKAIDTGGKIQFQPNAKYKITAPLILKHGTLDNQLYNNLIDFNYCHIIPYFDDYAIKIESVGDVNNSTSNIAYFDLKNLYINLGASPKSKALKIGGINRMIDSFQYSTITNFLIEDTSNKHSIVTIIENARHIRFVGVVHRGCGVQIQCQDNNAFCGDMEFLTCEFAGNSTRPPLVLIAGKEDKPLVSSVRGITFNNCDVYGSSIILKAVGKGDLGDIWFDKVQFDAPPSALVNDIVLDIYAKNNARLFQLHFSQCYFVGYVGIAVRMQLENQASSAQIDFSNCHFGNLINQNFNLAKAIILVKGFSNFAFNNCEFLDIKTNSIFSLINTQNFKILGNKTEKCENTEFLVIINGESDNYIISNNLSNTTNPKIIVEKNLTTNIKRIINNNLHIS